MESCERVLKVDPDNVKALFRAGKVSPRFVRGGEPSLVPRPVPLGMGLGTRLYLGARLALVWVEVACDALSYPCLIVLR